MGKTSDELKNILEKKKLQKYLDTLAKKYADKKILAYGTGLLAENILDNYDLSKLNIIGFADSKYLYFEQEDFKNYKTFSPDQIEEIKPDLILLCVYNDLIIKEFFEEDYPEIKIPMVSVIPRNFLEKIRFFILEC
ncbi:MAG: hypothetical protein PHC34_00880 [Candidatus Gastranaerophilales bacterium]|nr:hypothetical protein [Candidatus Gastranaerophilales bacterium]